MSTFIENLGLLAIGWIISYLVIHNYQRNKDTLEIRERLLIHLHELFVNLTLLMTAANYPTKDVKKLLELHHDVRLKYAIFIAVLYSYIEDEDQFDYINKENAEIMKKVFKRVENKTYKTDKEGWDKDFEGFFKIEIKYRHKIKELIKPKNFWKWK